MIHYLDLIRHWIAFIFQPFNFGPNISASVLTGGVVSMFIPVVRRYVGKRLRGILSAHHSAILSAVRSDLAAHKAEIKAHIESTLKGKP